MKPPIVADDPESPVVIIECPNCRRTWGVLRSIHAAGAAQCPGGCGSEPPPSKPPADPVAGLAATDIILMAIQRLCKRGVNPPHKAVITVEAWTIAPLVFGLPGYKQRYPNSHRVEGELAKMTGRPAKGNRQAIPPVVTKPAEGCYVLNALGRERLKRVRERVGG